MSIGGSRQSRYVPVSAPDGNTDYAFTHGHQGGQLDLDTGLYDNFARWYNPGLGRFVQQDPNPAGPYFEGMSLYQYVGSNPPVYTDPDGLQRWYQGWGNMVYVAFGGYGGNAAGQVWKSAGQGAADGAMAWANGVVPFVDPIPKDWFWDYCDDMLRVSEAMGHVSRDAWLMAAIPNIGTWGKNPALYEIGSKTLPAAEFASYSSFTAIERGALLIRHKGLLGALKPTLNPVHYSGTVFHNWSGLTPGGWILVVGLGEVADSTFDEDSRDECC